MTTGWSEKIRQFAAQEYVEPARREGVRVTIPIGEIHRKLRHKGFPSGHIRQICTSLESRLFSEPLGLNLESPAGQPDRVTTVFTFRFKDSPSRAQTTNAAQDPLLELVGSLREAIAEGAEAFLHQLRKDRKTDSSQ